MSTQTPMLAEGVEALGPYQGSAYVQDSFLVRRPDGQVVQLSSLLYQLLESVDGERTSIDIASRVSTSFGRTVSADNVDYLLESKFAPLGLLAEREPACSDKADAILALRLRVVLLRERQVRLLGRLLAPLFLPLVVVIGVAALVVFDGWLFTGAPLRQGLAEVAQQPVLILVILALALGSALFHECGHAAACSYGGAEPGVIGMGIYVVWPAFYTNVTDSYRLTRAGRIRTDLGGVYFNALFALMLAGVYLGTGFKPLLWAILIVHIELIEQLIPTFRFDGYFILGDLAGVPDLFSVMLPVLRSLRPGRAADPRVQALKRGARIAITSWVLVAVPVLAAEFAFFAYAGPALFTSSVHSGRAHLQHLVSQFGDGNVPAGLLSVASLLLLLLPIIGLIFVLQMTVRRLLKVGKARKPRQRSRRSVVLPITIGGVVMLGVVAGGDAGGASSPPSEPLGGAAQNLQTPGPAPLVSRAATLPAGPLADERFQLLVLPSTAVTPAGSSPPTAVADSPSPPPASN